MSFSFCLKVLHFVLKWAGTDSNPFSLDALAVFMYRVLQRVNHPVCSCRSLSYLLSHFFFPFLFIISESLICFNSSGKS